MCASLCPADKKHTGFVWVLFVGGFFKGIWVHLEALGSGRRVQLEARELHTLCVCACMCFGFPWHTGRCDHCAARPWLARSRCWFLMGGASRCGTGNMGSTPLQVPVSISMCSPAASWASSKLCDLRNSVMFLQFQACCGLPTILWDRARAPGSAGGVVGRQDNSSCFLNQGNAAVQGLGNTVPACWVTELMETLLHSSVGVMQTDSDLTGDNRHCQLCLQIISRKDAHPRLPAHGHLHGKV